MDLEGLLDGHVVFRRIGRGRVLDEVGIVRGVTYSASSVVQDVGVRGGGLGIQTEDHDGERIGGGVCVIMMAP